MQKQDSTLKFTPALINKAGYPRWDKAWVSISPGSNGISIESGGGHAQDTTVVFIPITRGHVTSAVMTVAINLFSTRDTAYNIVYPQHYSLYGFDTAKKWSSRNIFTMFSDFDKQIFDADSAWVFDGRIFGKLETDTLKVKRHPVANDGPNVENWELTSCVDFTVCEEVPPKKGFRMPGIITESIEDNCFVISICNIIGTPTGGGGGGGGGFDPGDPGPLICPSGGGGGGSGGGGGGGGGVPGGLEDILNIPVCPASERISTEDESGSPCPTPWVPIPSPVALFDLFVETLTQQQQDFINDPSNNAFKNGFKYYLYNHEYSQESEDFVIWGINFLISNPATTFEQFQNWFMGESEGSDGGDPFNFNDYSNVQVPTYPSLPGRNAFYDAFPKDGAAGMSARQVYQLVGGNMWIQHDNGNPNYQNACAIRVSRALNYSGHPVPVFKNNANVQRSEKGDDNKNYILDAASLLAYMKKAYPNNPPLHLENKTPEEFLTAINGKWGIYIMIPKPNSDFDASGHADFFSFSGCLSNCYFNKAKEIYFWELF